MGFLKCRKWAAGRTPDTFPPEKLVAEFEGAMTRSYGQIDNFNDEIRNWITDKLVDLKNIEPRQKRFSALADVIVPAPPSPRWDGYDQGYDQGYEQGMIADSGGGAMPLLDNAPGEGRLEDGSSAQPGIWAAIEGGDTDA